MALQDSPIIHFPDPYRLVLGSGTIQSMLLDAALDQAAFIVQVPKTGNISKVYFRTGTVTTPQTLDVGIFTIDAAGDPTTTAYGGMTVGSQASPASSTGYLVTLGTAAAATKGDRVAIVIDAQSGTPNLNIVYCENTRNAGFPYVDHSNSGTWTKDQERPITAFEYDDGAYYQMDTVPFKDDATVTFNSGTGTFDEYGVKFQLPFKCRATGMWMTRGPTVAGADYSINIYTGDSHAADLTISLDGDHRSAASSSNPLYLKFASTMELAINTNYRLTWQPSTTNNGIISGFQVPSQASIRALLGTINWHRTKCLDDAGAWTDETDIIPCMGLIIDQLDDGVGGAGGGMLVHPGMAGGMRG